MAAIDDLIAQIEDKALRERLRMETNRITKEKKFGLVFEDHLPELTPIYSAKVRRHSKVALRGGPLSDLWRALTVRDGEAHCRNIGSGETREFSVSDLVVVRQFGEMVFPALAPVDRVQNGPDDAPWHTLIEAENYHALQLLEYLYAGKVDCIYIDPPYNTGARDWKYNNDYVDRNDRWRHSKWLAMMRRRLVLGFRLLKPDGIMVITIDDYEVHNLRALLNEPGMRCETLGIVAVKNNPAGRSTVRGFSVAHEYAIFLAKSETASIQRLERSPEQIARYKESDAAGLFEWGNFRKHGGTTTYRKERPKQFYPIYVHGAKFRVPKMEWIKEDRAWNVLEEPDEQEEVLWPIDDIGNERVWSFNHETTRKKSDDLVVKPDHRGRTAIYRKWRLNEQGALPLSWWDKSLYSSAEHGTNLLKRVFGETQKFSFPKSMYAVKDCLRVAGVKKPNALVVDFFAGSATTLHAVNLLNAEDNGSRRCILVTNNEVSEELSKALAEQGVGVGDEKWEENGICRSVAWPRSKYTILGKRDDGSELEGECLTGKITEKHKARKFQQAAFTSFDCLNTAAKKKQLVALVDGVPQSEVKKDTAFVVSEKHPASILFDDSKAEDWLEALKGREHITDFYIVTARKAAFDDLKARICELLGPVSVAEEEKRPMREGFPANLEYFRLDFLDKDYVALGRQFREILPILWLQAGALGPRPELPKNKPIPAKVIPEHNPFAVLVQEARFADFAAELEGRDDLTHVYLVTDSEEAFQEMAGRLKVPNVIQIYRDYLENFAINKGEGSP